MLLQLKCLCANVASLRKWDENGKGQCTPLQNKRHVVFPLSPLFHQAHYLYSGSLNYCARCVQIGEDLTSLILHRCATLPFWLNRPGKSLVGSSLCNYLPFCPSFAIDCPSCKISVALSLASPVVRDHVHRQQSPYEIARGDFTLTNLT